MSVSVIYREREYKYIKIGSIMTWVDDSQDMVPVMLHSILRERAISSGVNSSVFLSEVPTLQELEEIKEKKISKVSKTVKKNNLMGGFNPFK